MISTTSGKSPLSKNEDQQGEIDLFDNLLNETGHVEDPHKSLDTQMDKVPIYHKDYWLEQYQGRFVSKELGKPYPVKQLHNPGLDNGPWIYLHHLNYYCCCLWPCCRLSNSHIMAILHPLHSNTLHYLYISYTCHPDLLQLFIFKII
jgi:hypothetical protein